MINLCDCVDFVSENMKKDIAFLKFNFIDTP